MGDFRPALRAGVVLVAALIIASCASCNPRDFLLEQIVGQQEKYFQTGGSDTEFTKLTDRVYTFRWTWYRNLIVRTDAGLIATDPFNRVAARELKTYLDRTFPGVPIHTLVYTHYHLDHTRGGAALAPRAVIAHEKCPQYWRDTAPPDVLAPTRLISGDEVLHVGGVELRLLYLGKSHTDTLYALYLPDERVLFTADFGLVRTIPPLGVPDIYFPGMMAAMERVSQLDFDIFVPSHFGTGHKADFLAYVDYLKTVQRLVREAGERYGGEDGTFARDAATLRKSFRHVYQPLKAQYGGWHGFDEQIFLQIVTRSVGDRLGY
jgi:glyoxylase-like metal-dependent hydrolase (beta-lactamase superfamily II)